MVGVGVCCGLLFLGVLMMSSMVMMIVSVFSIFVV